MATGLEVSRRRRRRQRHRKKTGDNFFPRNILNSTCDLTLYLKISYTYFALWASMCCLARVFAVTKIHYAHK